MKEFVDLVVDLDSKVNLPEVSLGSFAPWSYSKYFMLKRCPFSFYLQYVLKVKVPKELDIREDPISAATGLALHEIAERIVKGDTLEVAYAATKTKYELSGLKGEIWEEKVGSNYVNLSKFEERINSFIRLNPIKRIYTEVKVGITKDYKPTEFFSKDVYYRGVLDLVILLECLDAIVIDHKTGGEEGGLTPKKPQLDWYKVLVHYGIHKIIGVQTGIYFMNAGEILLEDYVGKQDIENTIKNKIEMSLEGVVEMLKELGYFKHIRGYYCKWCKFDQIGCKNKELKSVELNTKRWFPIKQEILLKL